MNIIQIILEIIDILFEMDITLYYFSEELY